MKIPFPIPIPKEHGAWGILLTSYVLGIAVVKGFNLPAMLIALAALSSFLLKQPIYLWLRRRFTAEASKARSWIIIYSGIAVLFSLPLVGFYQRWWLLPMGITAFISAFSAAWLQRKRLVRSIWGEFLAVVQLTMTAPATLYSITGEFTPVAWKLWGLLILYYTGSIFYVKLKVTQHTHRPIDWRKKLKLGWQNIAYQVMALLIVIFGVFERFVSPLALVAFVPNSLKALIGTFLVSESLRLKVIGWMEVGFSTLYALLLAIAPS
jgi:hypothetical protein